MVCGCKKSFCNTNRCKCQKIKGHCGRECACDPSKCKNQEVVVQDLTKINGNIETKSNVSWEEVESMYLQEMSLLQKLRQEYKEVPDDLKKKIALQKSLGVKSEMEVLLLQMEQVNINRKKEEVLADSEWVDFNNKLLPCTACGRKFLSDRHKKHESICKRRTQTIKSKNVVHQE